MHVAVIGAGVVGVTTAYCLRQHGMDVTVIERNADVALGASFANAGVIAPAYVGPWAQPGMPRKVFVYLLRRHAPVSVRPTLDPALWRWLRRWYAECDLQRYRRNLARMRRLAFYSRDQLRVLRARLGLTYGERCGYLQLFRTERELQRCAPARQMLADLGVPHELLTPERCRRLEPALAPTAPLAGALHLPDEEAGDCAAFSRQLKEIAAAAGVAFRFGARATGCDVRAGTLRAVRVDDRLLAADACVLAAGADSAAWLARLGIDLPLYPVLGYSATVTVAREDAAPRRAIMDEDHKVAITRLGERLRIAGTAEVGSHRLQLRPRALRTLIKVATDWFPGAASYAEAQFWVGARPMLPDGPPLLGPTAVRNLFLNIGHGSSGWALACGSAQVVADLVAGRKPAIDLEGLTLARYASASE